MQVCMWYWQGDKVGLYLQTRVCIQTFLDFWVCKRSVFYEKGLYSDENGRSNDKVVKWPKLSLFEIGHWEYVIFPGMLASRIPNVQFQIVTTSAILPLPM